MITPIRSIINNAIPQLIKADVAIKKIELLGFSLINKNDRKTNSSGNEIRPNKLWSCLEFRDVRHQYPNERGELEFYLGPLDFKFSPGEIVFIVGGNGSGKSTLVKLLIGLYSPESGSIYLDNQIISDLNQIEYRQFFSVVFSDFYLFNRLIGLHCSDVDEQAKVYLSRLKLEDKVAIKNGNFSTTKLSQGQRKRLALLTAYLEDRQIYVFDEWASDQDPIFRSVFYYELLPALKKRGKTIFVVSHDDRYFDICDRIIRLDYGKIVEDRILDPDTRN